MAETGDLWRLFKDFWGIWKGIFLAFGQAQKRDYSQQSSTFRGRKARRIPHDKSVPKKRGLFAAHGQKQIPHIKPFGMTCARSVSFTHGCAGGVTCSK